MIRGERKARGASRRMFRSPTASGWSILPKEAIRPSRMSSIHPRALAMAVSKVSRLSGFIVGFVLGNEAWRRPGKGDHGQRMDVGSRISEAGIFSLRRCLTRGNEADVQCLRLDHHARDMAFDQLAVCKDGRRLFPHTCNTKSVSVTRGGIPKSAAI